MFTNNHNYTLQWADEWLLRRHENTEQNKVPPAWTQEAYRPPRSKYSLCCSVLGGGGRPQSWLGGGGTPSPDLTGGYSSPVLVRGPRTGAPTGQDWGTPLPERTWEQWPGQEPGTEVPPACGQTHTCENSTFPIFRMRAVTNVSDSIRSRLHSNKTQSDCSYQIFFYAV